MVFTMAASACPGTRGFVGEFLVIVGSFKVNFWLALLGAMGMILGAAYMLYFYRRVVFGRAHQGRPAQHPRPLAARDRRLRPAGHPDAVDGHLSASFTQFFDASVRAMVQQHTAPSAAVKFAGIAHDAAAMNWAIALPEIVLSSARWRS